VGPDGPKIAEKRSILDLDSIRALGKISIIIWGVWLMENGAALR